MSYDRRALAPKKTYEYVSKIVRVLPSMRGFAVRGNLHFFNVLLRPKEYRTNASARSADLIC